MMYLKSVNVCLTWLIERLEKNWTCEGGSYIVTIDAQEAYVKQFSVRAEADSNDPEKRYIAVGGEFSDGSGYVMKKYLLKGTKEEVLEYLRAPGRAEDILEQIKSISESIRERGGRYRE